MQARRAYTLIEVMVAVAVIALAASLIMPGLDKMKAKAQRSACLSNLRQIGVATMAYHADHQDMLAWCVQDNAGVQSHWWRSLLPYTDSGQKLFRCPSDRAFRETAMERTVSYGWNYALGSHGNTKEPDFLRVGSYPRPGEIPIVTDGPGGAASGQEDSWGFVDQFVAHTADPKRHEGVANVLYLDGHVSTLPTQTLPNNPLFDSEYRKKYLDQE